MIKKDKNQLSSSQFLGVLAKSFVWGVWVKNGCVLIQKNRLGELAEKTGLSRRLFLKVIDRWLQDGTDAPAFLKMVEADRYALGSHFKQAQDFIIEAGKKEINMSKAGKKSIAKRNSGNFKD